VLLTVHLLTIAWMPGQSKQADQLCVSVLSEKKAKGGQVLLYVSRARGRDLALLSDQLAKSNSSGRCKMKLTCVGQDGP
jgi:hypothetical protein